MSRDPKQRWRKEVGQIESIADTKGVDIDDIEVIESTTDEGDDLVTFRVYETRAETDEDSVGVQVSKMPNVQTGDMTFRDDVQNKISALKRHLNGDDTVEEEPEQNGSAGDDDSTQSSRTRSRNRSRPEPSGNGPGSQIDAEIEAIHDRLDEFEERLEAVEEKSEALDGLQQLMQGDSNE